MNLLYRFILFILILLFMFASLLLAIYGFGFTRIDLLPDMIRVFYHQWGIGLLFIIGFIAGAWIIYPFFTTKEKKTLISNTDLGEVDITLEALDNLIKTVATQQEGVEEIVTKLKANDDGLCIYLKGKVLPNMPIAELTRDLQTIVKSYIEDITGVKVEKVKVLVEGIVEEKKMKVE